MSSSKSYRHAYTRVNITDRILQTLQQGSAKSGPRIKSCPCSNTLIDKRLFSGWARFSRTLIVDADWLSYTHWCWLAPIHLTRSVTSPVTFLVKFGKLVQSWLVFTSLSIANSSGAHLALHPQKFADPGTTACTMVKVNVDACSE